MTTSFEILESSIEIAAPPAVVFERWTRFEEFPQFMEGIAEVRRITERKICWRGKFAGETREWDSDITVWIPSRRIAWRATSAGAHSSRTVCVERLGTHRTRLKLEMLIDLCETWAQMPGTDEIVHRLRGDLDRFRALVESSRSQAG